ncbi:cellulose binding domain-containing protein [Micromonospora sp. KC721]|uniref:cellulose binding domain-containing protein n=1 Tax=Micromonospora sp. KC721 TaxID=2530380 RepID=UPI0010535A41|nr:cellulose binding domain-containing protein [Micromonospora sp. KC721]TDB78210.1 cellulose-binding protein [Micromonospora sp. KC721]
MLLKRRSALVAAAVAAVTVIAAGGMILNGGHASADTVGTQATSAGCGKAPTLTSGTRTIQSGGQNRSYILRVPDSYNSNHPYRVMFSFHWWGGTAEQVDNGSTSGPAWSYYGLRPLANNTTIFVAPQGIGNAWPNSGGRDLTFVDDMVRQIGAGLCVDTTQLFASGFSYGAGMTYAIACARANVFRGVVLYAGGVLSGCEGGTQPIAYFGIHGLRDTTLSIAGGRSMRDRFVRNNGCTPQNPREPAQGSLTHVVTYYTGCRPGYPVVWGAFDGPHAPNAVDGSADPYAPGARSWTQREVWNFITQLGSNTPPTTPPPTTPPPTTPPPGGACSASYRTVNSWQGGFQGEVTVQAGSSAITSWTVQWALGSGQSITQLWSGTLTSSGSSVTVRNAPYNGALPASGSTTFGFIANGTPSSPAPTCTSP